MRSWGELGASGCLLALRIFLGNPLPSPNLGGCGAGGTEREDILGLGLKKGEVVFDGLAWLDRRWEAQVFGNLERGGTGTGS